METLTKRLDGYGQAPVNPATHSIYCYYPPRDQLNVEKGQYRAIVVFSFKLFAAKRFVELMLEGGAFEPFGENRVMGENEIEIYCPQGLDVVMDYKFKSTAEAEWMPQPEHAASVNRIKFPRFVDMIEDENGNQVVAPKPVKEKKEKVEKTPKPTREGLIDVAAIAADLKCDAKDCRNALRKAKYEKPDAGWVFAPGQVDEVKAIVTKFLERERKA